MIQEHPALDKIHHKFRKIHHAASFSSLILLDLSNIIKFTYETLTLSEVIFMDLKFQFELVHIYEIFIMIVSLKL